MRLGTTLRLLISTLGILHECHVNGVYAGECENRKPYVPYPDSNSWSKYRMCSCTSEDPWIFDCPPYLKFNERTQSCTVYLDGHPIGKCASESEKFKDPEDNKCKYFFECDYELHLVARSCDIDQYFNPLLEECVPKIEYSCGIPDCSKPEFQGLLWVDEESCEGFFECFGDVLVWRKCPDGTTFSAHYQSCMLPYDSRCKVPESKPDLLVDIETMCKGNVGKFLPDPYYCKAYYYCFDESTPSWGYCDQGLYFTNGMCTKTRPSSCTCEDEDWDTNGQTSVIIPHPDNRKFYICKKGRLAAEKSCPAGTTFDATWKACMI